MPTNLIKMKTHYEKTQKDYFLDHKIKCEICGKVDKIPDYAFNTFVFGEEVMSHTYNCECGHKQKVGY